MNANNTNTIIVDLDGTIALIKHRRHLVEIQPNFEKWFLNLPDQERFSYHGMPLGNMHNAFKRITGWNPDWTEFYKQCVNDTPNKPVIELLQAVGNKYTIIIYSGRSAEVKLETIAWLQDARVPFDVLMMRPEKDYTPDDQLKAKWIEEHFPGETKKQIQFVLDDRDKVVQMWRSKGLTCFQVAPGNF